MHVKKGEHFRGQYKPCLCVRKLGLFKRLYTETTIKKTGLIQKPSFRPNDSILNLNLSRNYQDKHFYCYSYQKMRIRFNTKYNYIFTWRNELILP